MISRTEMLEAFRQIDYRLIDTLRSWVINETNNLDSFINNPTTHVNYNPFVVPDYSKLLQRLYILRATSDYLYTIVCFLRGDEDVTEPQYENAIDHVHVIFFSRLLEWVTKRRIVFEDSIKDGKIIDVPIKEYEGLYTINEEAFMQTYMMYKTGEEALRIVVEYKQQIVL